MLAVSAWDGTVRVYNITTQGYGAQSKAMGEPRGMVTLQEPVLCVAWAPGQGGESVLIGCADGGLHQWNIGTGGNPNQIGKHAQGIRHVFFVKEMNMIVTGSWDRTVAFWNGTSPNPAFSHNLSERVYAMDVKYPAAVIGTANRQIYVLDLANPQNIRNQIESPLKFQTKSLSIFPDKTGFAVSSIEGRVGIQFLGDASKNYVFKCHRDDQSKIIYPVNGIDFHMGQGTLVTCGSDGILNTWDKDSKMKLKSFPKQKDSIVSAKFNPQGNLLAYLVSYDWHKGHEGYDSAKGNTIAIHTVDEKEVAKKASANRYR